MILKENFTLKTMVTLVFCENSSKNKETRVFLVKIAVMRASPSPTYDAVTIAVFTRLRSRRVVMCLVGSFIHSFVPSLIESRIFNIF